MTEKPKSPWAAGPESERVQLEFQRKMLAGLHEQLRVFARAEDITYDVEQKDRDSLAIVIDDDDRERVQSKLFDLVRSANELSESQDKSHQLELDDRGTILIIGITKKRV